MLDLSSLYVCAFLCLCTVHVCLNGVTWSALAIVQVCFLCFSCEARTGIRASSSAVETEDQTYPCTESHSTLYFSNLRHSLHANLCVGGEYNYIRVVVNKDLQAAVCSSIPPRREQENSLSKDEFITHTLYEENCIEYCVSLYAELL